VAGCNFTSGRRAKGMNVSVPIKRHRDGEIGKRDYRSEGGVEEGNRHHL